LGCGTRRIVSGWRASAPLALLLAMVAGCANDPPVRSENASAPSDAYETGDTERAAVWFEDHRNQPPALRIFLQRMPKGGDLHSHLSGAVYAESYLAWAAEENYCAQRVGETLKLLKCDAGDPTMMRLATLTDSRIYNQLIDEMSTRNLAFAGRSGHSDFFAAFRTASPISRLRDGEVVAEVATRAAEQRTYYLELMISPQNLAVRELGRKVGLRSDFASTRRALLEAGLANLVEAGRNELDHMEKELQQIMDCDGANASPGCAVTLRFLQQTSRNRTPAEVFAQLVFAVEFLRADSRMVGLNLISPEDDRISLRDYTTHMQMLEFLVATAPEPVNVALHAGELTLGLVPPEELRLRHHPRRPRRRPPAPAVPRSRRSAGPGHRRRRHLAHRPHPRIPTRSPQLRPRLPRPQGHGEKQPRPQLPTGRQPVAAARSLHADTSLCERHPRLQEPNSRLRRFPRIQRTRPGTVAPRGRTRRLRDTELGPLASRARHLEVPIRLCDVT